MNKYAKGEAGSLALSPKSVSAPLSCALSALDDNLRDDRGAAMLWMVLTMTALIGMAGLGLDAARWYLHKRDLQSIADASVIAATHALVNGGDEAEVQSTAAQSAAENAFMVGAARRLIVNNPPTHGANAGNSAFVEVIAEYDAPPMLSSVLLDGPVLVAARAEASAITEGEHCVLGLDEHAPRTVSVQGTADINLNCGVASNSDSNQSLVVQGNATLQADPAQAHGDISIVGNAQLITVHPAQPFAPPVPDPFGPQGRNLQVPPPGPCDPNVNTNGKPGSVFMIPAGRHCSDIQINAHRSGVLESGVHIFDGASLRVNGQGSLSGTGVTLIFTGFGPDDVGNVDFRGGADIDLTAPTSGEYRGVLIYQDQAASTSGENLINGGADVVLKGAIYTPKREVRFAGGADIVDGCLQLVARIVTFTGNAAFPNDEETCANFGLDTIPLRRVKLTR